MEKDHLKWDDEKNILLPSKNEKHKENGVQNITNEIKNDLTKNLENTTIKNANRFYVYAYLDPRKPGVYIYDDYEFDYEPFYIGKGTGYRFKDHLRESKKNINKIKSPYKYNKIEKILKSNMQPIILKLHEELTNCQANNLEINLIKLIGRKNLNQGSLCNLTDGGYGSYGLIIENDTREKLSKLSLGKKRPNCTSKFHGVRYDKNYNYWIAYYRNQMDGKASHIGCYKSETEAAIAYNKKISELENNDYYTLNQINNWEDQVVKKIKKSTSSKYYGVSFDKRKKRWSASVCIKNKVIEIYNGFKNEIDAARAYDKYIIENDLNKKLNNVEEPTSVEWAKFKRTSTYKGVTKVSNKWRCYICLNNKIINLGYFLTELEAAKKYNEYIVLNKLNKKLNIL